MNTRVVDEDQLRLSVPYVSYEEVGRYGRDFYDPMIGGGRIEEAPPIGMDPNANIVSRVIVRFFDDDEGFEEFETVDTKDVAMMQEQSMPCDVWQFRRQIIHEKIMLDVVRACIYHMMNPNYI